MLAYPSDNSLVKDFEFTTSEKERDANSRTQQPERQRQIVETTTPSNTVPAPLKPQNVNIKRQPTKLSPNVRAASLPKPKPKPRRRPWSFAKRRNVDDAATPPPLLNASARVYKET